MAKGGKGSPEQQDPGSLMAMQAGANQLNQSTPFGAVEYYGQRKIRIPGKPDIMLPEGMRTTLSPGQQRIQDQREFAQQRMGDLGIGLAGQFGGSPMAPYQAGPDYNPVYYSGTGINAPSQFSQSAFSPGDFEASRGAAERAVFDRGMSLMRPELEREEASIRQRLANQGLPQRSEAFKGEMGRFERGRGEQMDRLAQSAVLQGLGAQQQGYGQALGTHQTNAQQAFAAHQANAQNALAAHQANVQQGLAGYQANAQQAQMAHQANAANRLAGYQANQGGRAQQLQEILGLFGLQGVQLPQAQQSQIDVPYQQGGGGQQGNAMMSGLLGLGGGALGAYFGGPAGAAAGYQMGSGAGMMF